jgi:hypothetical protein
MPCGQKSELRCLCFSIIPSWLSFSKAVSSHQTFLRSGGDSWGAFRSLTNVDSCGGNIANGGLGWGSDSRGLVLLVRNNGVLLGLSGLRNSGGSGGLLLDLLGVLALGGLAQGAAEGSEDGTTLLLLGWGSLLLLVLDLGGLGLGLDNGSGDNGLDWLSDSWCGGVLDLGCDRIDLAGLSNGGLVGSSWRLGAVLAAEELSEREVLLLLAGSGHSGLGLSSLGLVGLQGGGLRDGLNGCGDSNLSLLERL